MIRKDPKNLERYDLDMIIKDEGIKTASGLLDFIYGTQWNDYYSDFVIKRRYLEEPEENVFNRLNYLWVVPVFFVIAPFRYIIYGEARVSGDSKLGNVLRFLLGDFK